MSTEEIEDLKVMVLENASRKAGGFLRKRFSVAGLYTRNAVVTVEYCMVFFFCIPENAVIVTVFSKRFALYVDGRK